MASRSNAPVKIVDNASRFRRKIGQLPSLPEDRIDLFLSREWLAPPRRRVIAPLDQFSARPLQLLERRRIVPRIAPCEPRERPAQPWRSLAKSPFEPGAKGPLIQTAALRF